ncbi:MAG: hypothetical protein K6D97_08510, partial [Clostridia bacterium]|nr:hypothetical protein [Clostridia bacterium]
CGRFYLEGFEKEVAESRRLHSKPWTKAKIVQWTILPTRLAESYYPCHKEMSLAKLRAFQIVDKPQIFFWGFVVQFNFFIFFFEF